MLRLSCISLGLFLFSIQSAYAKSSKKTFVITSNVEGAQATALNNNKKKKRELGSCTTPCELVFKSLKLTDFKFTHPDYPDLQIRKDYLRVENWNEDRIEIIGNFSDSFAERAKKTDELYRTRYSDVYEKALNGPDNHPVAILRTAPNYPFYKDLDTPGWCKVNYGVSDGGQVINAKIESCSDERFSRNSLKSIKKWRYIPAVRQGEFVYWKNMSIKLTFHLNDKNGNPLPIPPEP